MSRVDRTLLVPTGGSVLAAAVVAGGVVVAGSSYGTRGSVWTYDYFPFFGHVHGDPALAPWLVPLLVDLVLVAAVLFPAVRAVELALARAGLSLQAASAYSPTWGRLLATVAVVALFTTVPLPPAAPLTYAVLVGGAQVAGLLPVGTSPFGFDAMTLVTGLLVVLAGTYLLVSTGSVLLDDAA